jgi:hypothetical protein
LNTNTNANLEKIAVPSHANIDACENPGKPVNPSPSDVIPYMVEWSIDVSAHGSLLGVTPVWDTLMWVSSGGAGGTSAADNKMYIYNLRTRTLVDSFNQTATNGWGYRDMCFYNGYVYAGDNAVLHKISPVSPYTVVGSYSVTNLQGSTIRALTYAAAQDSLFSANWASRIHKYHITGGVARRYPDSTNIYSTYGLGYDPAGYVWAATQTVGAELVQFSYPNYSVVNYGSVPEMTSVGSIAGGCEMWRDTFLLYVAQGDRILCLRVHGFADTDMKTSSISAPASVTPYKRVSISAIVQNVGLNTAPASTPVKMLVTGPSGYSYPDIDEITSRSLAFGDTNLIVFSPEWQAPGVLGTYTIKVWTELAGDLRPANDTLTTTIDITNWITYADFSASGYYYTGLTGEEATWFIPRELNVIPPVTIDSVLADFYGGPTGSPYRDSLFTFKVYAGDGLTLLYESDTIRVPVVTGARTIVRHGLPTPLAITGTSYVVSVVPHGDSFPMLLSTQEAGYVGRSLIGTPGNWSINTNGEWHIASFVSWTPRNNDVGADWIVEPTTMVAPEVTISPKALISNYGFNTQGGFQVTCKIDSAGTPLYTGTASAPSMLFGDTATVTFSPTWTPGPVGAVYDITVYTGLGTDEYLANDTVSYFTSSFVITNNIFSNLTAAPPTIDGNIQTSEWSDAEKYDVSDVLGQEGIAYPAGSAFLYVKHDANNLYVGCDLPYAATVDDFDQLGVYLDDNNDGVWATDSSEGNYWLVHYSTGDSVRYRAIMSSNPMTSWIYGYVPSSAISVATTSGHLQFEGAIPIGTARQNLNVNTNGDTVGLWFFAQDNPTGDRYAYWPQDMSSDTWPYPDAYGNLIFRMNYDVGVTAVLAPAGALYQGSSVTPKAVVQNYGNATGSFPVTFTITEQKSGEYTDTKYISLGADEVDTVEFDQYVVSGAVGNLYGTEARTALPGDGNIGNDVLAGGGFTVLAPPAASWTPGTNVPAAGDLKVGKLVKDGGSMVAVGPDIYAFPGNKSWQFYKYEPYVKGSWTVLESIPYGYKSTDPTKINKKKIGKGAALCYDGTGIIYATKGNGTTELWAYNILANTWTAKAFVPVPKALKGGTSLAYLDGKVYLLAGGQKKTDLVNFYVYDIATDAWTPSGLLTLGPNVKIWKDGACLTKLDGTLYALKSNDKYNPFFSYDVLTNTWTEFDSIPMVDSLAGKLKKVAVKDGGAMCASNDAIYAIKGGGTIYFWKYTTGGGWTRSDSIPRLHKKSVAKTGAALTFCDDMVYLMKGNNNSELWSYGPVYGEKATARTPVAGTYTAVMTEKTETALTFNLNATPNPFTRTTTIRYAVPTASSVTIRLYSANGRLIETIHDGYLSQGVYTKLLTTSNIARGIYFLRYEDNHNRAEIKLINQ